jgi:hypothetical protein
MPDGKKEDGFDDLMHDLEDNIFGITSPKMKVGGEPPHEGKGVGPTAPTRRTTLPTLVDQKTANDILADFMKKEKNQRRYDVMGVELLFKPYWFFTYSAELVMRDNNKNITDAEELSGRVAIDAGNAALADYLQDLLDHEPIETVDLVDEMTQTGGEAKIIEPKINEDRVERMVQQKIAGVLKTERDQVAVAGFELLWSPVYRFWLTIKKKTHNVQIDGCGGYPINYDEVPAREKTWSDVIMDDVALLKNPKKWGELLKNKRKAVGGAVMGGAKGGKPSNWKTAGMTAGPLLALIALYGIAIKNFQWMAVGVAGLIILFWYANHQREKPLIPLPPPPFMGGPAQ